MKEIVQDDAPVLRGVAKPVPEGLFGSAELARLIDDMKEALDKEPEGAALAAPQIGVPYRLFIIRKDRIRPLPQLRQGYDGHGKVAEDIAPPAQKPEVEVYINPEIVKTSRKRAPGDEGCLSVRGVYGTTNRHERVTISARHFNGSRFMRGAGGLIAQIFQHEMDHLNGILFTDHAKLIHLP